MLYIYLSIYIYIFKGGAGPGYGDRRGGGEDQGPHAEHCSHPPGPEGHHQGQNQVIKTLIILLIV